LISTYHCNCPRIPLGTDLSHRDVLLHLKRFVHERLAVDSLCDNPVPRHFHGQFLDSNPALHERLFLCAKESSGIPHLSVHRAMDTPSLHAIGLYTTSTGLPKPDPPRRPRCCGHCANESLAYQVSKAACFTQKVSCIGTENRSCSISCSHSSQRFTVKSS
jgi:hypothetical protein